MDRKVDLTPSKVYVDNYDSTSSEYDSDRDPEFQPTEDDSGTKLELKNLDITKFREEIVLGLQEISNANNYIPNEVLEMPHKIITINKRSRCVYCYEQFVKKYGLGHAVKYTKQIKTACQGCNENIIFVQTVFFINIQLH